MPWLVPMKGNRPGKFFSWRELTVTSTGLPNDPPPEFKINLRMLCYQCLDPLREHIGRPIHITSGYRSHEVNSKVGGSVRSFHTKGLAADFKVHNLTSSAIMRAVIDSDIPFDQCIAYAPERGGHVHLGFSMGKHRRQTLWAPKGGGYEAFDFSQ